LCSDPPYRAIKLEQRLIEEQKVNRGTI
jgi:hypothetical protein